MAYGLRPMAPTIRHPPLAMRCHKRELSAALDSCPPSEVRTAVTTSSALFSERLQTRQRVWWAKPNKWRNRDSYRHLLHRLKENHTLRSQNDPDDRWHCCALWQRTLSNKWNAREFVQRYGCRVPALYWWGRRVGNLPINTLPDHFVIRPVWGDSRRGVYVFAGDRELLRQRVYTKAQLMAALRRERGWVSRFPVLVEEFVKTEAGEYRLPTEFKCHTFGDTIGAIEVVQRSDDKDARYGFYTASWQRFEDQMNVHLLPGDSVSPPKCLDEMLACARRLGGAYGTYVRIDFYATDHGCVFGEFSSTPDAGRGYTPFADRYYEELWQRTFPDRT